MIISPNLDTGIQVPMFQTAILPKDLWGAAKKSQENALFFAFCVTQAHLKDNIYSLWVDAVLNRGQAILDPNSASTTSRA